MGNAKTPLPIVNIEIQQFSHPPCSVVNSCFHCILPFFRILVLFEMGILNSLNPVSKFSHITQASSPEFAIDGHYCTPNQQVEPPTLSFSHSGPLPDDASQA
jgi:hypothetical protein